MVTLVKYFYKTGLRDAGKKVNKSFNQTNRARGQVFAWLMSIRHWNSGHI